MHNPSERDSQPPVERIVSSVWREIGVEVSLPIRRMTYHQAMTEVGRSAWLAVADTLQYGVDKPDTRFDMKIQNITSHLRHCGVVSSSVLSLESHFSRTLCAALLRKVTMCGHSSSRMPRYADVFLLSCVKMWSAWIQGCRVRIDISRWARASWAARQRRSLSSLSRRSHPMYERMRCFFTKNSPAAACGADSCG